MKCPFCGNDDDKVVDTRPRKDGREIRRKRVCSSCNRRFVTVETVQDKTLYVIKSDGRREPYDAKKLMRGIQTACNKRPVSMEQIEDMVGKIETEIQENFFKEVESRTLGELVSKRLRQIDEVAYVRFASVYRKFKDKEEFYREIKGLQTNEESPE